MYCSNCTVLKKTGKKLRNLPTGWVHLVQDSIFAYFLDCATKTPVIRHFFQEELGEGRPWKALAWLASKSIRAHLPYRHGGCCIWSTCSVLQDLFPCLLACDHSTSATKLALRKDESALPSCPPFLCSPKHPALLCFPLASPRACVRAEGVRLQTCWFCGVFVIMVS